MLARRDRGFSADEHAEFQRWIEASPEHAAAYATVEETWRQLDGLQALRPADAPADPDLLAAERVRRRDSD